MAEPVDSIVEERKAFMVASTEGDQKPIFRTAHFLKPSLLNGNPPPLSPPSLPISSDPSKWPLKVNFSNWAYHLKGWSKWVDQMEPKHGALWKKVGIFEAIKASASLQIVKDPNLILELAQRWSPDTNTFIFPWGEATVTLEDVAVIGGYSVLGSPVSTSLKTEEMIRIEQELENARAEVARGRCQKPSIEPWRNKFMDSGSEIEHAAFLALWLSRFVFNKRNVIKRDLFKVAVNLANGKRIAIAPAVLAGIYRDLTVMKKHIVCFVRGGIEGGESVLRVWSPFVLVQVWVWERFPGLRPNPNPTMVRVGETRIAQWVTTRNHKIKKINSALEFDEGGFQWRPYAESMILNKESLDFEKWVSIDDGTREDLLCLAKFMVPSELVGLDDGCTEQYFPHRVSMQFGMDQDLPGQCNSDAEIVGKKLYVPSRLFKPGITYRYRNWWEKMKSGWKHGAKVVGLPEGISDSLRDSFRHLRTSDLKNSSAVSPSAPPGFKRKVIAIDSDSSDEEDRKKIKEFLSSNSKVKRSKSSEDAPTSCARSSNAKDVSMRNRNLLEEDDDEVLNGDEEVGDRPNEIAGMDSERDDFSARDVNLLEEDDGVEIVGQSNPNGPDIEVLNGAEEVGRGANSEALGDSSAIIKMKIDDIRARLTNAKRNFAEITAARSARH